MTTPHSWGATEYYQNIRKTVEPIVEIAVLPSQNGGIINAQNGSLTPIGAKFSLVTNSNDNDYDFVLQANVKAEGDRDTGAYFENNSMGYIILANTIHKPSGISIENIKNNPSRSSDNPNAIAYPLSTISPGAKGVNLRSSSHYGGYYYEINKGDNQFFTVNQTVSGSPLANTYSFESDRPGMYEAVVTFSAYRKP